MSVKQRRSRARKPSNLQIGLVLLLFAFTAILARDGNIAGWERVIFRFLYGLPEILTPFFLLITMLGSVYVLLGLALVYFFKQHYELVRRLLITGALAYVLAAVGKSLLGRPRPLELLTDINYRDLVHGPGFPSGHAALATALALSLEPYIPLKYRWAVPASIIGVCLSRIYLGVHAPLDVIGGFALGWLAMLLFRRFYPLKLNKKDLKKWTSKHKLKVEV